MNEIILIILAFIATIGIYLSLTYYMLYRLEKKREDKMLENMIKAIKIYEGHKEEEQ